MLQLAYVDVATGGPGDKGFHGLTAGGTSFIPDRATIGSFLGGDHFDPLPVNTDMLPNLATGPNGGQGFAIPLPAGTYTFFAQQTGPHITDYTIDFVVSRVPVIPTPSAWLAGGIGLAAVGSLRRMRRA